MTTNALALIRSLSRDMKDDLPQDRLAQARAYDLTQGKWLDDEEDFTPAANLLGVK